MITAVHLASLLLTLSAALAVVELEVLRVAFMALAVFALVALVAALAVLCRMRLWASSTRSRPSRTARRTLSRSARASVG